MRIGDFTLNIVPGTELENGYVQIEHNTQFTIRMANMLRGKRCTARVKVNGDDVGSFRIGPMSTLNLEHPSKDMGRFTFYVFGTPEGDKAGLNDIHPENLGLVQVMFIPERWDVTAEVEIEREVNARGGDFGRDAHYSMDVIRRTPGGQSMGGSKSLGSLESFGAGGVGLSGKSNQRMKTVTPMELDETQAVTISLRLVVRKDEPRPIKPVRSNPVPPFVI